MPAATKNTSFRDLQIAINEAQSEFVDIRWALSGSIYVPNPWTSANISFMVKEAVTSKPGLHTVTAALGSKLRTSAGVLVVISSIQVAEAGWYDIPAEVFDHAYVAIRSTNTASEADLTQAAARSLYISLTK